MNSGTRIQRTAWIEDDRPPQVSTWHGRLPLGIVITNRAPRAQGQIFTVIRLLRANDSRGMIAGSSRSAESS